MNAKVFPLLRETSNCLPRVLGLAAVGLSLLLFGCSPEPRYKTLPDSHWLKQVRDPDAKNRYHAAHALGEMGPSVEGALPALITGPRSVKLAVVSITAGTPLLSPWSAKTSLSFIVA